MIIKINRYLLLIALIVSIFSCNQTNTGTTNDSSSELNQVNKKAKEVFEIKGESIPIRVGPGKEFDKLINKKATEILKETQYAQVDYSVKVKIEESKGEWSKIKVVEPNHLSNTHVGWIPTKYIIRENEGNKNSMGKLDHNIYEIIKTEHKPTVQNFHVLIKYDDYDRDKIHEFIKKFRNQKCTNDCNINIYDSKSIQSLVDKYPLEKKEYIELADHFIALSSFDAPEVKSWYPFQDFQYKEYGGKNWKKEPIK